MTPRKLNWPRYLAILSYKREINAIFPFVHEIEPLERFQAQVLVLKEVIINHALHLLKIHERLYNFFLSRTLHFLVVPVKNIAKISD